MEPSITDVEDKSAAYRDVRKPIRMGLLLIVLGFGGFVLWSATAPLDEGVPSMATVAIDTNRKAVQHNSGGIVRKVLVKEGQLVKEDDPLLMLNDTSTLAAFESARQQYFMLRAMHDRLLAEKTETALLRFHPDLEKNRADPLASMHMNNQRQLFETRRRVQANELSIIDQNLKALQEQLGGVREQLVQRQAQSALLTGELGRVASLIDQGFVPMSRRWELERAIADVRAAIADAQANIGRLQESAGELKVRRLQQVQQYHKEIETLTADVMRTLEADSQRYVALKAELDRTVIRAPATGQVIGLSVQTEGAVIQAGQKLMDIVPEKEELLIEAKIAPNLIDRVAEGDPVDVRFSTFAHSPQLVVAGKVHTIAKDLLNDAPNGAMPAASYYLARIELTPEGLKALGQRQMQAGMPAEVVIRTGERTVLQYILHPLIKRIAASMKEE
jgi:protease secretion system membrane fusion protein